MAYRKDTTNVDLTTFGGRLYQEAYKLFGSLSKMSEITRIHLTDLQRWASNIVVPKIDKLYLLQDHGFDMLYLMKGEYSNQKNYPVTFPDWAIPVQRYNCPARGGTWNIVEDEYWSTEYLPKWLLKGIKTPILIDVVGNSMSPEIQPKDILIIDRTRKVQDKDIIVCTYDSDTMVKRIRLYKYYYELVSTNPKYPPIKLVEEETSIFGVVVKVIHDATKKKYVQ